MSSWQCKKRYGDSFSSHGTLCAGSPPDTSLLHDDSCQGNSGGGLVCQEETGRWVLTGVVAGGYGCGDPSSPSLYSRVSRFRSWIDEVIDARAEEPRAHSNAQEDLTHKDLTHTREDTYLHTHGQLKHTPDQQETNEINDITHTHRSHASQHAHTHTKSTHAHREADTNTQILVWSRPRHWLTICAMWPPEEGVLKGSQKLTLPVKEKRDAPNLSQCKRPSLCSFQISVLWIPSVLTVGRVQQCGQTSPSCQDDRASVWVIFFFFFLVL